MKYAIFFQGFLLSVLLFSCSKETPLEERFFDLEVISEGEGSVSTTSGSYQYGTTLTLTAVAEPGFFFDRWEGNVESEDNPLALQIVGTTQLTAVFTAIPELTPEVVLYTPKKIDANQVLLIENGGKNAYVVDKTGTRIKSFMFPLNLGNDFELLPDGTTMGIFKPEGSLPFSFGGYGGILRHYDVTGNLIWEYGLHTNEELLHHDFEVLPNGNVLVLVWERIPTVEAKAAGVVLDVDVFPEKIIEIDPTTNSIVWEWRSWEHLVQDQLPDADNFGVVNSSYTKIDINYVDKANGDIMHANALAYDAQRDLIYMSVNFFSEVWVINHSTTTEAAQGTAGDLVYRFGNPEAYQGEGQRLFDNNHHPNFISHPLSLGNMLIYSNGTTANKSIVYELSLPTPFLAANGFVAPEVVWSFSHPDLYFSLISGAVRLPNGNTLICEGDYGYWEVTPDKEVVWKYDGGGQRFWRGYLVE
jgi:hypothetical protein